MSDQIATLFPHEPSCPSLDFSKCRSLGEIITPSLTALFGAIYLSVHLNVPQPNGLGLRYKALIFTTICLVSLLFPEWIFAWAVRSFVVARRVRVELERARKEAIEKWYHAPVEPPRPSACELYPHAKLDATILLLV